MTPCVCAKTRATNIFTVKPFRRRHLWQGAAKTLLLFSFLFSVVLGVPNRNLKYLSEAHFEFSIDLYRQIADREDGNIVISAQNINLGLAMLFLGTTANTSSSTELRRALHYENMSYVDIHKAHQEILGVLDDPYYTNQDFLSKVCSSIFPCFIVSHNIFWSILESLLDKFTPTCCWVKFLANLDKCPSGLKILARYVEKFKP